MLPTHLRGRRSYPTSQPPSAIESRLPTTPGSSTTCCDDTCQAGRRPSCLTPSDSPEPSGPILAPTVWIHFWTTPGSFSAMSGVGATAPGLTSTQPRCCSWPWPRSPEDPMVSFVLPPCQASRLPPTKRSCGDQIVDEEAKGSGPAGLDRRAEAVSER